MPVLDIAVVGAGAAGNYAVQHLLEQTMFDVRIDLIERLPTPWGLIRMGVAPDHPEKKKITERLFQLYLNDERVRLLANVAVSRDISHDELAARYHAVIYATGTDGDRTLDLAGEDLPGSWSTRQFVGWYNGHPACRDLAFDLSGQRAVIVGTGNVALDVARILTLPDAELAKTDIADHAREALAQSNLREVIVLGRGGCRQAAFHNPELEEFLHLDTVDVRIEAGDLHTSEPAENWVVGRKLATLRQLDARRVPSAQKRITFKFHHRPLAIRGTDRIAGLEVERTDTSRARTAIDCDLLLRAIGYRGTPMRDLPFDADQCVIRNHRGRVVDYRDSPVEGVYVSGWIKRGPRGVIGSNKQCAAETIACLLADASAGVLNRRETGDLTALLAERGCTVVTGRGWQRIDGAERRAGAPHGRSRIKLTHHADLLAAAGPGGRPAAPPGIYDPLVEKM